MQTCFSPHKCYLLTVVVVAVKVYLKRKGKREEELGWLGKVAGAGRNITICWFATQMASMPG